MSSGILVDRDGQLWSETSEGLRRSLNTDRQGAELSSFLVKSLGYVHVAPRRSSCIVALNERTAHPVAVVGTIQWIAEHKVERILIKLDAKAPARQMLLDRRHAITYLGNRADDWAHRLNLYSARPVQISPATIPFDVGGVRQLLGADMEDHLRLGILTRLLGDHFLVARRDTSSGEFAVDQTGPAWQHYRSTIGHLRSGTRLTAIRDRGYGHWAAKAYDEAAAGGSPVAHDVEATLGAGTPTPVTVSYRRVLLPYSRSGESRLLIASRLSA